MGKAISSIFGMSQGDNSGLNRSAQLAEGFYNEGSADYAAQKDNRTAFGNQLANSALGKGPSIAEAQMNQAQDKSLAQQMAAARANKSVNPALAFRTTQRLGAEAGSQIAQAAGIAKLQEQQGNQQQYQNYLSGIQGQRAQALGLNTQAQAGVAQANAQQAASENAFAGNLIGAAGQIGAAYMTGGASLAPAAVGKSFSNVGGSGPAKSIGNYGFDNYANGGVVPGPEIVKGDSEVNDVIPAKLSGGEMVVPKTVVAKGPEAISSFAQSLLSRSKGPQSNTKGFESILAAQADLNKRLSEIETKYGKKK